MMRGQMQARKMRVLAAALCLFCLSAAPVAAGEELPAASPSPAGVALELPAWLDSEHRQDDLKRQPVRFWRKWADRRHHFLPAAAFIVFASLVSFLFFQPQLTKGQEALRSRFWRSLITGAFLAMIMLAAARLLFISEIGQPLAYLALAILEAGLVAGLALTARMLGAACLARAGLASLLGRRPLVLLIGEICLGALLIAGMVSIPPVGGLPPVGVRLAALCACLGLGAIVVAVKSGER